MRVALADTSFLVAYLSPVDAQHEVAHDLMATFNGRIVTSTWILAEFGNFLSVGSQRRKLVPFLTELRRDRRVRVLQVDETQFEEGLSLYDSAPDKRWSLVDCISFTIMRKQGIREALTTDHHFHQAGFRVLL
jgi:predicted nucleic acid-binding protein